MAVNPALMKKLFKLDGAVQRDYDPYQHVITPPSPSLSYIFDNSWGLPLGFSLLLWGEQKSGKSLIARMMAGALHRQDPDAVVVNYNTELRETLQVTDAQLRLWGIDPGRYVGFDTNRHEEIFPAISNEFPKLIQEGLNIKLVIIDSTTNIKGRKAENSDSTNDYLIGDNAQTVGDGLKMIVSTLRRHHIACILVSQARAEFDMLEQKRGKNTKMAASFAVKHAAEYFVKVDHLKTAEGKADLLGNALIDTTIQNVMSSAKDSQDGDIAGRKMRVTMEATSCGRDGRVAIFTLHKDLGLINTHEEVFLLGAGNFGVIEEPSQGRYQFGGRQWHGKKAMLEALRDDTELCKHVLAACKKIDLARREGRVPESVQPTSTPVVSPEVVA